MLPSSLQVINEFQTTHLLDIGTSWEMGWFINNAEFSFPWDQYQLSTSFIVVNHDTNATLPILALTPVDTPGGFLTAYKNYRITNYFNGTADAQGMSVLFLLKRTPLVKAFSLTIYLVNWLLVGMTLFITVIAFLGKNLKSMPDGLLLLPVTVILIVPSLRALMVDSPTFGKLIAIYCITLVECQLSTNRYSTRCCFLMYPT
jgi:hypothetical protein